MVWVRENKEVETYFEKPKKKEISNISNVRNEILDRQSKAKDYEKWLIATITLLEHDNNLELAFAFKTALEKYKSFEKKGVIKIKILEGWKSTDSININKTFNNNFMIESHVKDKNSGEIKVITKEVMAHDVNKLREFIATWKIGESKSCYEFAKVLGYKDWQELWKVRKSYFTYYYYPLKVLEAMGVIEYGSRSTKRLK